MIIWIFLRKCFFYHLSFAHVFHTRKKISIILCFSNWHNSYLRECGTNMGVILLIIPRKDYMVTRILYYYHSLYVGYCLFFCNYILDAYIPLLIYKLFVIHQLSFFHISQLCTRAKDLHINWIKHKSHNCHLKHHEYHSSRSKVRTYHKNFYVWFSIVMCTWNFYISKGFSNQVRPEKSSFFYKLTSNILEPKLLNLLNFKHTYANLQKYIS